MGLLNTKGPIGQAADAIDLSHLLRTAARSTLDSALGDDSKAARDSAATGAMKGVSKPMMLVAGGAMGITAASAAVSAIRHKAEARDA